MTMKETRKRIWGGSAVGAEPGEVLMLLLSHRRLLTSDLKVESEFRFRGSRTVGFHPL